MTVLVFVVEPPRAGDRIHTLQKEFEKYRAGTIFHRGAAHTEPARPSQVRMLEERLLAGGVRRPELDLALTCTADPLVRLNTDRELLDAWLQRHEAYVRANSGKPSDPPPPPPELRTTPGLSGLAALDSVSERMSKATIDRVPLGLSRTVFGHLTSANREDAQEFDRRVQNYLVKLRRGLLMNNVVKQIVRTAHRNKVYFGVGNETDEPVSGVQLTVRIPKSVLLVYTDPPPVDPLPPLPKWPDRVALMATPALHLPCRTRTSLSACRPVSRR